MSKYVKYVTSDQDFFRVFIWKGSTLIFCKTWFWDSNGVIRLPQCANIFGFSWGPRHAQNLTGYFSTNWIKNIKRFFLNRFIDNIRFKFQNHCWWRQRKILKNLGRPLHQHANWDISSYLAVICLSNLYFTSFWAVLWVLYVIWVYLDQ